MYTVSEFALAEVQDFTSANLLNLQTKKKLADLFRREVLRKTKNFVTKIRYLMEVLCSQIRIRSEKKLLAEWIRIQIQKYHWIQIWLRICLWIQNYCKNNYLPF
jgi:hypothetical protein